MIPKLSIIHFVLMIVLQQNIQSYCMYHIAPHKHAYLRFIILFLCLFTFVFSIMHQKIPSAHVNMFDFRAGEIHYARIPVQYWENRILTVKAMGLNALSVYIMWNYHQIEKGKFDYETQNKNLHLFLTLAQKHNMSVLIRPGPYVCAQWDFGGFPARLYSVPNLKVRSNNNQFLEQTRIYFQSLVPILRQHIRTAASPNSCIILLQIQNEYGSYGNDLNYIKSLITMWQTLNITIPIYHEDSARYLVNSHIQGMNVGLSGGTKDSEYSYVRSVEKKGDIFGGEIYTGWLTHWGEPEMANNSIAENLEQFSFLLMRNLSFSMYMIHGGSNFGLTAGANQLYEKSDFTPHVTTYDYDSPINQQGSPTQKYKALRNLIQKYTSQPLPQPPVPIPTTKIPRFTFTPIASMLSNLPQPALKQTSLYHFESDALKMFNQGFVIYETILSQRVYYFRCVVRDYAIVVLDGNYVVALNRSVSTVQDFKINCTNDKCQLRIIVQAMGHVNYDRLMDSDIKGLFNLTDDKGTTFKWNHYKMPIDEKIFSWETYHPTNKYLPTLLKSQINIAQQIAADTYLDTSELTKGYIFINNRNLGRYWNIGPQKRVFCPGVWMNKGKNVIWMLQLGYDGGEKGVTGWKTMLGDE